MTTAQSDLFGAPAAYTPRRVILLTGGTALSDSEAWRNECEALTVLRIRDRVDRRLYVAKVRDRRGPKQGNRLEDTVLLLHQILTGKTVVKFAPDVVALASGGRPCGTK